MKYKENKRQIYVYSPSTILEKESDNGFTNFYHDDRNSEKAKISWSKFQNKIKKIKNIDLENGNFNRTRTISEADANKLNLLIFCRMKFGYRKPSLRKRVAARTSWKRVVRHNLGFKAPRGYGWLTNPKKAAYNRIYNRTTKGCMSVLLFWTVPFFLLLVFFFCL